MTHKITKCCPTGFGLEVGDVFRPIANSEGFITKMGKVQRSKQGVGQNIKSQVVDLAM